MSEESSGLMSFDEWSKLSAENRHRFNRLVGEIRQLTDSNAALRAKNDGLQAENERLKDEIELMRKTVAIWEENKTKGGEG